VFASTLKNCSSDESPLFAKIPRNLKYFLTYLSQFYDTIPAVAIDGSFGPETTAAVQAAQRTFGLTPDGIVGERTWYDLTNAYLGIVNTIPREYVEGVAVPYGGVPLRIGSDSDSVRLLQEYQLYLPLLSPDPLG
jgi:peptidoglycan hydrolase-like protein with peptidoglycan-binding domain